LRRPNRDMRNPVESTDPQAVLASGARHVNQALPKEDAENYHDKRCRTLIQAASLETKAASGGAIESAELAPLPQRAARGGTIASQSRPAAAGFALAATALAAAAIHGNVYDLRSQPMKTAPTQPAYDRIGRRYTDGRRPDPRIATRIARVVCICAGLGNVVASVAVGPGGNRR